jgi:hypothetical protein
MDHRSGSTEAEIVEDEQAFYLIPGTIVQIIKEDPTSGMSRLQMGGFTTLVWTYSRFLSKHPIPDIYGTIETPENSGLIPNPSTAIRPNLGGRSTASARYNRNQSSN